MIKKTETRFGAPRTRFLLTAIPLGIFLLICYICARGLNLDPHEVPSALINKATPEFNLPELFDEKKQLNKDIFLGHISLLNVWASWCSSCMMEHPVLADIAGKYAITIYGLNYEDERENAKQFLKQYGNPYKLVGFDQSGKTGMDWGVYGTPETFLIDKKGIIRYKHLGPMTEKVWQEKISPLVKQLEKE